MAHANTSPGKFSQLDKYISHAVVYKIIQQVYTPYIKLLNVKFLWGGGGGGGLGMRYMYTVQHQSHQTFISPKIDCFYVSVALNILPTSTHNVAN